jgi:sugar phosphate isomerase/epimerase
MGARIDMSTSSRRDFLRATATGAAAACIGFGTRELRADPLGMPIGFQTYPVRDAIAQDFKGTLERIAGIGYRAVEMCSPPGYAGAGYAPLIGMKAADMRRTIEDAGLRCVSCHYQFRELKDHLDERAAFAKELGLTQMIVAAFGLPAKATLADWKHAADDLNTIGEKLRAVGIQCGYHNHDMEFEKLDGSLIYDELLKEFDPKLVRMQFQVAVIRLGFEAAPYFTKYPGRFLSLHLADWSSEAKRSVAVGKGVVDWPKLFAAARTGGVENSFVELNLDMLPDSYTYLHGLKG